LPPLAQDRTSSGKTAPRVAMEVEASKQPLEAAVTAYVIQVRTPNEKKRKKKKKSTLLRTPNEKKY
jgi:hypothetical protein